MTDTSNDLALLAIELGDCDWLKTRTLLWPLRPFKDGLQGAQLDDFDPDPRAWRQEQLFLQAITPLDFGPPTHLELEQLFDQARAVLGPNEWLVGGLACPYQQQEAPQLRDVSSLAGKAEQARPGRFIVHLDFVTDFRTLGRLAERIATRPSMPLLLTERSSGRAMGCTWAWSRFSQPEDWETETRV